MEDTLYAIPDDQITCPPVSVGFSLLQGLIITLLIRQVTETLTGLLYKSLGSRVNLGEHFLCGSRCMKILRDSRDVGSHAGVSLSEPLLMQ